MEPERTSSHSRKKSTSPFPKISYFKFFKHKNLLVKLPTLL